MSIEYSKKSLASLKTNNSSLHNFSNDGSIDVKQRRKRKLEKPLKIPINLNLTYQNAERNEMKSLFYKSLPTDPFELELEKRREFVTDCTENYDYIEKSNRNEKRKTESRNIEIFDTSNISNISNAFDNRNQTRTSIFLVQPSQKKKNLTRIRRNSECCISMTRKVPKVRRKSCDNVNYFVREPVSYHYDLNNTIAFNEVESQLEKMFAGITEGDTNVLKNKGVIIESNILSNKQNMLNNKNVRRDISSTDNLYNIPSNHFTIGNEKTFLTVQPDKKKNVNNTKKYLHALSESSAKNKKKRLSHKNSLKNRNNTKNKKKCNKMDQFRDAFTEVYSCNQIKYKGPIIQMKSSNTNNIHVEIVNVPREEDEEKNKEKRRTLNNGVSGKSKRLNHHQNNVDYRGNYRIGELFNSTLSSRYDSCTTDSTWICVFCKKGPHFLVGSSSKFLEKSVLSEPDPISAFVLSDLFGPFSVVKSTTGNDLVIACNNVGQVINIKEKQQNKTKCDKKFPILIDQLISKSKRRKKYSSDEKKDVCMDVSVSSLIDECCDIWVHEQCIIWSVGIYMTGGGRINGLQDAVRDSMISVCSFCGINGANIKCLKKGCDFVVHYCCAINSGWHLSVGEYISKCNIHK